MYNLDFGIVPESIFEMAHADRIYSFRDTCTSAESMTYLDETLTFTDVFNSSNPQDLVTNFQDSTILIETATTVFRAWTAQLAGLYLVTSIDNQLALNVTTSVDRLRTRVPSLWFSEAALLIAVFSILYLMWQSSRFFMSRDPSSIGGLATVLAGSPTVVQQLVQKAMVLDERAIRERMSTCTIALQLDPEDGVAKLKTSGSSSGSKATRVRDEDELSTIHDGEDQSQHVDMTFHVPYAVTRLGMLITVLAPLCVVVALEILYRYSLSHKGLATSSSSGYVHYTWSLLPALVMTGIKLMCGSLGSVVLAFQPFHAFQKGQASSRLGLLDNYSSQTAVQVVWTAAVRHQWAAVAVTLTSIVTPLLTIFVSGLFNLRGVDAVLDLQISQTDHFNNSMAFSTEAQGSWWQSANVIAENSNTSFSDGTYENLVFPRLELHGFGQGLSTNIDDQTESALRLRVTASSLRGNANCTVFKSDQILNDTYNFGPYPPATINFSAIPPTTGCNLTSYDPNPDVDFNFWPYTNDRVMIPSSFEGSDAYHGYWYDLELPLRYSGKRYHELKPDCPRAFTFFAKITNNRTADITALYCSPFVEQLDVDITYTYPDLEIDPETPPVPHDSTARYFSDTMITIMESEFSPISSSYANTTVDDNCFYDAIMFGRNAVDPDSIVGEANQDALNTAINRLYGQLIAVFLNTQRIPLNSTAQYILHNATVSGVPRMRLFQDAVSTRVLQGLLVFVTICSITAFMTMDTRHIVPINPNSIAGMASLLAGADMLDRRIIPEGAEWMSDAELHDIFQGYVFSLGWFGEGEQRRFGIDIGQAEKVGR